MIRETSETFIHCVPFYLLSLFLNFPTAFLSTIILKKRKSVISLFTLSHVSAHRQHLIKKNEKDFYSRFIFRATIF